MTTEELRRNLSGNIKIIRKRQGLTQEKLAEKADLAVQTINDIEGCRSWVSDKSLIKIAMVLNVTPAELLLTPINLPKKDISQTFLVLSELKNELQNQISDAIERKINSL